MARWRVCPECDGEGTVVHPALSVWTAADRQDDPEGFGAMMNGEYDRRCQRCRGRRVVRKDDAEAEDWNERLEDARTVARESGDPEAYYNPRMNLY